MKCIDCRDKLSAYIDNELNVIDQKEVQQHLQSCKVCMEEIHLLRQMQEAMKDISHIELPKGFHEQLMQKVDKDSKKGATEVAKVTPIGGRRMIGYLSAVAAALLIVWVGNDIPDSGVMEAPEVATQQVNRGIVKEDKPVSEISQSKETEKAIPKVATPEITPLEVPQNEVGTTDAKVNGIQSVQQMTLEPVAEEPLESIQEIWRIQSTDKKATYEKIMQLVEQKGYSMQGIVYEECVITFNTAKERQEFKVMLEEILGVGVQIEEMLDTAIIKIILSN